MGQHMRTRSDIHTPHAHTCLTHAGSGREVGDGMEQSRQSSESEKRRQTTTSEQTPHQHNHTHEIRIQAQQTLSRKCIRIESAISRQQMTVHACDPSCASMNCSSAPLPCELVGMMRPALLCVWWNLLRDSNSWNRSCESTTRQQPRRAAAVRQRSAIASYPRTGRSLDTRR